MAKSVICMSCSYDFISEEAFQVHKKSGHQVFVNGTPLEGPQPTTEVTPDSLPAGIPPEALPSAEFIKQVQQMEKKEEPISQPSQHPSELPQPKELKLSYLWVGECPTCRITPTSIELDVAEKHFSIAICERCKSQLGNKEVIKL